MIDIKKLINYTPGGITSKVVHKGKSNITLFCMAAGTDIEEHTSTREAVISVIEGKGSLMLNGEAVPLLPGSLIIMPPNAKHSLTSEKNTAFMLFLA